MFLICIFKLNFKNMDKEKERVNFFGAVSFDWKSAQRKTVSSKKIIESPIVLQRLAFKYFEYVEKHLWQIEEQGKGRSGLKVLLNRVTPMNWRGFRVFIRMQGYKTTNLKALELSEPYVEVFELINDVMYNQKFAGAAIGAFNANLIARDLDLAEKTEVKQETKLDLSKLSDETLEELAKQAE